MKKPRQSGLVIGNRLYLSGNLGLGGTLEYWDRQRPPNTVLYDPNPILCNLKVYFVFLYAYKIAV